MTRSLHHVLERLPGTPGSLPAALLLGLAGCIVPGTGVHAQSFIDRTSLVDVHMGSSLGGTASSLGRGGYELSDGTPVDFAHWYTSDWRNLSVTLMSAVDDSLGVYWGLQTGERGRKYTIEPALNLGFIYMIRLSRRSTLSFTARAVVGGWLREKSCTADYGAIGGVQTVNCRLAASPLPPADTLAYLADTRPPDWLTISLRYDFRF